MKLLTVFIFLMSVFGAFIAGAFLFPQEKISPAAVTAVLPAQSDADNNLKEKIGQMIIIGFRGTEASDSSEIYKIVKDTRPGGVAFFDYDVPSQSYPRNIINPDQTKKLVLDLQKISKTPLFVSVDAEGGSVNRLKEKYGFEKIISPKEMAKTGSTEAESEKLAEELKALGFNMNLAPAVDLDNKKSPIIGAFGRAFSSLAQTVTDNAAIFIKNHINNGIIAVAKHFPGQGNALQDSHLGLADVTNTYKPEELFPYKKLNERGVLHVVMAAHLIDKNIDPEYPATLSSKFLEGVLREQIGFEGVIMADDMQMAAIAKNYDFDEAITLAINAGVDILFFSNNFGAYDPQLAYKTRDAIFNAVKDGKISKERVDQSYDRIIALKKQYRIIQPSKSEILNSKFEMVGEPDALTFGSALENAKYAESVTGTPSAFLLAIFQEELMLEKSDLCYLENTKTGDGIRVVGGGAIKKVMKPDRDIKPFLEITKELGKDWSRTPVTCPMSFGWGGAMGPADFIPSAWKKYEDKVEKITGKPASPWDIKDAFLAAGLYLADFGAKENTFKGRWSAAMLYFSDSVNSGYDFYAKDVMLIEKKIQNDINFVYNQ